MVTRQKLIVTLLIALLGISSANATWYISRSGLVVLTRNYYGNIEIIANNVTLNLNGYSVIAHNPYPEAIGVRVENRENVTIMNGTISGFYVAGIDVNACKTVHIDLVTVTDCYTGIYARNGSNAGFCNGHSDMCTVSDNTYGIRLETNTNGCAATTTCVSVDNQYGVYSSLGNGDGIRFGFYNGNTYGLYLNKSKNSLVDENYMNNNDSVGVYMSNYSQNNHFVSDTMNFNGKYGLQIRTSSYKNTFDECEGQSNAVSNRVDPYLMTPPPNKNTYNNCNY